MKDLIAKLQMDANCALGAIWMHIDAQAARIAELEAQVAAKPADTDKLREAISDEQIMRIAGDVWRRNARVWPGDVAFARAVLASTALQAPVGDGIANDTAAVQAILDGNRLQAPVREVPGWRPIETAPKDGTCILVCRAWDADGKPMGDAHGLFTHRAAWWADENGGNGEWVVYNSMVKDPECFFTPTHWMPVPDIEVSPLPAAPVQEPKP